MTACAFIRYGQAAAPQEECSATQLAELLQANLAVVDFHAPRRFAAGEIRGRNAFLVIAALMMCELKSGVITLGIHAGTPYYDCTPGFLASIDRLTSRAGFNVSMGRTDRMCRGFIPVDIVAGLRGSHLDVLSASRIWRENRLLGGYFPTSLRARVPGRRRGWKRTN